MDPLEEAIRNRLERYLTGLMSLDELKDWLIGATWNAEGTASPKALQLGYAVELVLAEESGGFLSHDELHHDLRRLTERVPLAS
jgi:hypothetical protein